MSARTRPAFLLIAPPIAVALGFAVGTQVVLPVLVLAAAYPFFFAGVKSGNLTRTFAFMMLWFVVLTVSVITATVLVPDRAASCILNGPAYWEEMRHWILTGEGREASPRLFIPQHALHFCAFAVLSLASGGFLGLALGVILTDYMSYYVAMLITHATRPWMILLFTWQPYALIRVASFVLAGIVLAEPAIARVTGRERLPLSDPSRLRLLQWVAGGLVADIIIKTLIAGIWRDELVGIIQL